MDATDAAARDVVCLLARAPSAPGKTRLTAGLAPVRAVALRRALFLDTLDAVVTSALPAIVCYTPTSAREEFERLLTSYVGHPFFHSYVGHPFMGCRYLFTPQSNGDLGSRMHAAFRDAFALGFDRVVLIGSDLPTLPADHLTGAMQALDRVPVVIGAAEDGGYYLIGLREPRAELFEGITWGSADVLAQTMAIARRLRVRVEQVSTWHDVDAPDDLSSVLTSSRARHTRAWLENRT